MPEMRSGRPSRKSHELEPQGESVKLAVILEIDEPDSTLIEGVSNGWPKTLASLENLLETGESSEATRHRPEGS